MCAEPVEAVEDEIGLAPEVGADRVTAFVVDRRGPTSVVASDATGDGPEYRYGGAAVFSNRFSSGGQARNAASDE